MSTKYQIFNPITGQHTQCSDSESAKTLVEEVSKQVLEYHKVTVCSELTNENGDATWSAIAFEVTVSATL